MTDSNGANPTVSVSVVIPAFNAQSVIRRALDSVLAQSAPAFEIIVVDDGSTDETRKVVDSYGDRVRYVFQQNAGVSAARNHGARVASGEWIAFLDADDEWFPDKLKSQTEVIRRNPQLTWCAGGLEVISEGASARSALPVDIRAAVETHGCIRFHDAWCAGVWFQTSTFMVRRSAFMEMKGFDIALRISEDRDFFWRMAVAYPALGYSTELCAKYYFDTAGSLTKTTPDKTSSLGVVCRHLHDLEQASLPATAQFRQSLKFIGFDYLLRFMLGQITLSPQATDDARAALKIGMVKWWSIVVLRFFPRTLRRLAAGAIRRGFIWADETLMRNP